MKWHEAGQVGRLPNAKAHATSPMESLASVVGFDQCHSSRKYNKAERLGHGQKN